MPGQLRRSVGNLRRLDPALLAPAEALRVALGVVLPLVVAVAVGHPAEGVAAAAGALSVGFASFQGVYRTRARAMVLTACGMAVSTLVGGAVGGQPVALVLVTALWALGAGLLTALGPPGTVIGLQCTVALIIVADFAMTPQQALGRAALVLAGGLLQTLLVVGLWPLRTRGQERRAVAEAFAALARYAADGATRGALPEADPFADAATALSDANPLGQDRVRPGSGRCSTSPSGHGWRSPPWAGRGPSSPATVAPPRCPSSTSCWARPRACSPASPRP